MRVLTRYLSALALALGGAAPMAAQELEPRALVNAPVGANFLIASAGYLRGNVLLDPSLPITDGEGEVGSLVVGYLRSIGIAGMGAKVGIILPTATGTWSGDFGGADTNTSRTGFGDPVFRVSLNFVGAPALALPEFVKYRQSFVAGANLVVTAPLGQYDSDQLINLGTNRWSIGPRIGASQVLGRVVIEGYASATFYTDNTNFFGGNTLSQDPLLEVQAHVIYLIRGNELWTAVSAGYGWGGRTSVNGGPEGDPLENARLSAMIRFPLARGHGLKLVYINGLRTTLGGDFDTFQLGYQYGWGGKR
jgi:hypothetical protein